MSTYFEQKSHTLTKVKLVGNILTPGECSAICSEEPACAFWSHLTDKSDCKIWSSDAVRLVFIFNPINVLKRRKILHINKKYKLSWPLLWLTLR